MKKTNQILTVLLVTLLISLLFLVGCARHGSNDKAIYGIWRLTNYEEFETLSQKAGGFIDGFACFDYRIGESEPLGNSIPTELTLYNDGKFLAICNNDSSNQIDGVYSITESKLILSDIHHSWSITIPTIQESFEFAFINDTLSITGSAGVFQFKYDRYDGS